MVCNMVVFVEHAFALGDIKGVANNPRIFRISATSLYDAGVSDGTLAKDLIQSAFQLQSFKRCERLCLKIILGRPLLIG